MPKTSAKNRSSQRATHGSNRSCLANPAKTYLCKIHESRYGEDLQNTDKARKGKPAEVSGGRSLEVSRRERASASPTIDRSGSAVGSPMTFGRSDGPCLADRQRTPLALLARALAFTVAMRLYHFHAPLLDQHHGKQVFIANKARNIAKSLHGAVWKNFDFLETGLAASFLFAISPLTIFYGRAVLPDPWMLACMLICAAFTGVTSTMTVGIHGWQQRCSGCLRWGSSITGSWCRFLYGLISVPAAAAWGAVGWRYVRNGINRRREAPLWRTAAILGVTALIQSPWVMGVKYEMESQHGILESRLNQLCTPSGKVIVLGQGLGWPVVHYSHRLGWVDESRTLSADWQERFRTYRGRGRSSRPSLLILPCRPPSARRICR